MHRPGFAMKQASFASSTTALETHNQNMTNDSRIKKVLTSTSITKRLRALRSLSPFRRVGRTALFAQKLQSELWFLLFGAWFGCPGTSFLHRLKP
jgi:hypothetical protein